MFLVVWFVLETDVKQCGQEGEERLGWGRVRGGGWEWVVEWGERGDKIREIGQVRSVGPLQPESFKWGNPLEDFPL